jgi:hypothetical protein
MKKIFKEKAVLFYGAIIVAVLFAGNVIAQTSVTIVNPISTDDFAKIIENVLLWVLGVSGSIALFFLILAGVMYITSAGDEQKIIAAKKIFNFTVIGLILILLSYSIIKVVSDIFEVW